MSDTFENKFYEAVARWLRNKGREVGRVMDVDQETNEWGGCPTCAWTEITVEIGYYEDAAETHYRTYTYSGNMADLIRELSD